MALSTKATTTTDKVGYTINEVYYLIRVLGSGASGTVYHARHTLTGQEFALKMIVKPMPSGYYSPNSPDESGKVTQSTYKSIRATPVSLSTKEYLTDPNHPVNLHIPLYSEVLLHGSVHSHPNIVSVIEVLDAFDFVCVVLDYCELGDLFSAITERNWYVGNESKAKDLFLQLLDAVEYCHNKSVYHCDLKPENILVTGNGTQLKIADFGLASQSPLCSVFGRGSSYYMAPETIAENTVYRKAPLEQTRHHLQRRQSESEYQRSSIQAKKTPLQSKGYPRTSGDVWALGIIFLNLIFGRNPWKKASMVHDSAYHDYAINYNTLKSILPVSDELNSIMALVFHPDPYRRISISSLRRKVLRCQTLTKSAPEFPWFKVVKPEEPVVIAQPQPVAAATSALINPQRLLSKNARRTGIEKYTSGVHSEITYVHIESVKTPTISIVTSKGKYGINRKKVGSAAAFTTQRVVPPPSVISPSISPLSDGASSAATCTNFSMSNTASSFSSASTLASKRKMCDNDKAGTQLYPITPERSLVSSAALSNTKVLFHRSSLYLCSMDAKRIRSASVLQG